MVGGQGIRLLGERRSIGDAAANGTPVLPVLTCAVIMALCATRRRKGLTFLLNLRASHSFPKASAIICAMPGRDSRTRCPGLPVSTM